MNNILVIFNNAKSIQYIFDAILKLSIDNNIYYYLNHQMSLKFLSNKLYPDSNNDIRVSLINTLNINKCINIGDELNNLKIFLENTKLDIAIIDDSNGIHKGNRHGYNEIYSIIKKMNNIPIVGCIEGIKNFNKNEKKKTELQSIVNSVNICYDYIFCFSKYQYNHLKENKLLENKIFKVGIPYLDKLNKLNIYTEKDKEYIIFFSSWSPNLNKTKWKSIDEDYIKVIIQLAKEMELKLIIKEKPRNNYSYKHLESDNVIVTMCEGNELDTLMTKSKLVISVPSTIILRCLFLNIPTIILNDEYYGQLGGLKDFKGVLNNSINLNSIKEKYIFFKKNKNYIQNYLKDNYYGIEFNSINLFINNINNIILNNEMENRNNSK